MTNNKNAQSYWRTNLLIVSVLLFIWCVVGYGMSIVFIEEMNQYKIGFLGLGFWMAQQGSIYVFVLLVLAYALLMDRVDRKHDVSE